MNIDQPSQDPNDLSAMDDSLESELQALRPRRPSDRFADSLIEAAMRHSQGNGPSPASTLHGSTQRPKRSRRHVVVGGIAIALCLAMVVVTARALWPTTPPISSPVSKSEQTPSDHTEVPHEPDNNIAVRHRLPTLATYHALQNQSLDELDELLAQHARELLPPTPDEFNRVLFNHAERIH